MQKLVRLKIEGMHCTSCETLIREELSEVKGISEISVDAKSGEGSVLMETDTSNENDILTAVEKAGYKAVIDETEETQTEKTKNSGPIKIILEQRIELEGSEKDIKSLNLSGVFTNNLNNPKTTEVYPGENHQMIQTPATKNIASVKSEDPKGINRVSLDIEGMHCSSCAAIIEKSLRKVNGVREANVNFAAEKASVLVDESTADNQSLIKAVEKAGYKASLTQKTESGSENQKQKSQIN